MLYAEDVFLEVQDPSGSVLTYVRALVQEPLWSPGESCCRRIPFRYALESKNSFSQEFDLPGCYVFGIDQRVLYVGRTTRKLWTRLRGRYFVGEKTQYQLARTYEKRLIERGISGFPPELIAEYQRQYHGSTVRLDGAVMFARCGVDDVWFHLLPTRDGRCTPLLEQTLMRSCELWNRQNGYEGMLNLRYER